MAELQWVIFGLGQEEYAISISQVKEIIKYKDVTKLPNMGGGMEGIISLRGRVIPVINLSKRLNVPTASTVEKKVLIIETENHDLGVIVDQVTEVLRVQEASIETLPMVAGNEYIQGIGKVSNRLLIWLDVETLFRGIDLGEMKIA